MAFQTVFERYELKYLLTGAQKRAVCEAMAPYMRLDRYGRTTIRNLYLDSDNYRLARRSIERPTYKEKLRIRSYSETSPESTVFAELKKKYKSVVYKRRLALTEKEAMRWLCDGASSPVKSQIADEIGYFLEFYGPLRPAAYLSYEREAFYALDKSDFRVTFDEQIRSRKTDLSLCAPPGGFSLLDEDMTLMEIKCSGGIPLWMTKILSEQKLYKTSFSKYGAAYEKLICPHRNRAFDEISVSDFKEAVCYA